WLDGAARAESTSGGVAVSLAEGEERGRGGADAGVVVGEEPKEPGLCLLDGLAALVRSGRGLPGVAATEEVRADGGGDVEGEPEGTSSTGCVRGSVGDRAEDEVGGGGAGGEAPSRLDEGGEEGVDALRAFLGVPRDDGLDLLRDAGGGARGGFKSFPSHVRLGSSRGCDGRRRGRL